MKKSRSPKPPVVNLRVRFPRPLLEAIKASAVEQRRSQNSEIVHRLAVSLGAAATAPTGG